jgi:hypothetical protein
MMTIDGRCTDKHHDPNDTYTMTGSCTNCGDGPFLMIFTKGHDKCRLTCPTCGSWGIAFGGVEPSHLATAEELQRPLR